MVFGALSTDFSEGPQNHPIYLLLPANVEKNFNVRFPSVKKIQETIENLPIIAQILGWSKTHSLPGFFKVPVYDVLVFLWNEIQRVTLVSRANAMAFSFFLSLFPGIIFLFTVATMLPLYEMFEAEINGYINAIMPTNAGKQLQESIKTLVRPNSSLLSLGFILAIYFASNGMLAMLGSFEKRHLSAFRKRPGWKKRLIAIGLLTQTFIFLLLSIALLLAGNWLISYLVDFVGLSRFAGKMIDIFRWLVILTLIYFSISLIYRYGSATLTKFRWLTPGATLATVLSVGSSVAFSSYVEAFDTYNKIYGSIGTIIVLMLWIQINCFVILVGFELNASIAENRNLREMRKEE